MDFNTYKRLHVILYLNVTAICAVNDDTITGGAVDANGWCITCS